MTENTDAGPARDYDALIGLGSNIGDKAANIARAIAMLTDRGDVSLVRRSRDWRSAPWGIADQDWFVNACAAVRTTLPPRELLGRCLAVEDRMGRVRQQKWGPRLIDVDVLTYGGLTLDTPELKLPHPYIEQRSFVVVPLCEIAPGEIIRGRPVRELAQAIDAKDLAAYVGP